MNTKTGRPNKQTGFTLVEILMTLVILGVLVGVAIPIYQDFSRESTRSDAVSSLHDMLAQQSLFFANHGYRYTTSVEVLGFGLIPPILASRESDLGDPESLLFSQEGLYVMALQQCGTAPLTECVSVAARLLEQQDDDCRTYEMNSRGFRSATNLRGDDTTNDCWN